MLKVGTIYMVKTYSDNSVTDNFNYEVLEVAMPLVRFRQFGKEIVLNVTSPAFVSAEPQTSN